MNDQGNEQKVNAAQPAEPAVTQPAEPAGPQPSEPVVPSRSDQVQSTVDRNLADQKARQSITDDLLAKRKQAADSLKAQEDEAEQKQAAALEAKADTVQAGNDAVPIVGPPEPEESTTGLQPEQALAATKAILAEVKKNADARELREIEMHNAMIDALTEVTAYTQTTSDLLSDIAGIMTDIAKSLAQLAAHP